MKQKTYIVPDHEDSALSYLNFAVREYIKLTQQSYLHWQTNEVMLGYTNDKGIIEGIISGLYITGRSVFGRSSIPWTYEVFKGFILNGYKHDYKTDTRIPLTYSYNVSENRPQRTIYYRYRRFREESTKYQRKEHHQKKEIDEQRQAELDWREHKGFNKDKRKCKWRRRSAGPWVKNLCDRRDRRRSKRLIATDRWDECTQKDPIDTWMWD